MDQRANKKGPEGLSLNGVITGLTVARTEKNEECAQVLDETRNNTTKQRRGRGEKSLVLCWTTPKRANHSGTRVKVISKNHPSSAAA